MSKTFRSVMHTFDGQVIVKERPIPEMREQFVLVENKFSTMSPGTHTSILHDLRKRKDPASGCYTLGYCGAGIVSEIGKGVENVVPGDRVAIYGAPYTYEGEYCLVPKLLCHKVPEGVSLEEASTTGLGVIAMHAVRRAQIEMGSRVLVIGMGVLGLISSQMIERSGGFLIAAARGGRRLELAKEMCASTTRVVNTSEMTITEAVRSTFGEQKLDSAIPFITGGQALGAELCRNLRGRGNIVLGGGDIGVNAGFGTDVEQNILSSRAGGPGRGKASYEQLGQDYPIEYVRFTEGRNMEIYLEMLRRKWVDVKPLIDRIYSIDQAPEIYEKMLNRTNDDIAPLFKFGS